MRRLMLLLALICPAIARAQAKPPTHASTRAASPAGYRLYHANGREFRVKSYEKTGRLYQLLGEKDEAWQLFETSVRQIEPISGEEARLKAEAEVAERARRTDELRLQLERQKAASQPQRPADEPVFGYGAVDRDKQVASPPSGFESSPAPLGSAGPNGSASYYRGPSSRSTGRSTPRTGARTTAPEYIPPPEYQSGSSPGTTATGIPLHVGPRGGVFHYSASGKKVYQKKH